MTQPLIINYGYKHRNGLFHYDSHPDRFPSHCIPYSNCPCSNPTQIALFLNTGSLATSEPQHRGHPRPTSDQRSCVPARWRSSATGCCCSSFCSPRPRPRRPSCCRRRTCTDAAADSHRSAPRPPVPALWRPLPAPVVISAGGDTSVTSDTHTKWREARGNGPRLRYAWCWRR